MRPGQKVFVNPGPDWGVRVIEPGFPSAAGGWWDDFGAIGCCIAAYSPEGAASYAASLTDLSGNGNDAAEGVAPGWDAINGWTFNGVDQYLDAGVGPPAGNQAAWSMICKYSNYATDGNFRFICGTGVATFVGFKLQPGRSDIWVRYYNGSFVEVVPALATGNLCVAGTQGYRNGVPEGGPIGISVGSLVGTSIFIGCVHHATPPFDTTAWFTAGQVQKLAIYDCILNAGEVAAVFAPM